METEKKVVGPKVGPAEPSCINDPNTGELITNKEQIKSTSLAHCVKILTKNPIRECDKEELERKEENHRKIMEKKDNGEYILDRKLYKMVMKDIKKKNKGMFKLLNNAGNRYKKALHEEIPKAFSLMPNMANSNLEEERKCLRSQPNEIHPHKTVGRETM